MKRIKKKINRIIRSIKEFFGYRPIEEEDIKKYGFNKASTRGSEVLFYKGNTSLKWNRSPKRDIVIVRWRRSLRYYGIVKTPYELRKILSRVFDYKTVF